jgi:hypothetical protein
VRRGRGEERRKGKQGERAMSGKGCSVDCDGAKASVGRLADGGRTAGEVYTLIVSHEIFSY